MSTEKITLDYFQSDEFKRRELRQQQILAQLVKKGVPFATAIVMSGDLLSAEEAAKRVQDGADPKFEYKRVGSYARLEWCLKNLPHDFLLKVLPEVWRNSDPDDSQKKFLTLWKQAYAANGNKIVLDDKRRKLPKGKLTVYRGQVGDKLGISWTTDLEIAKKFALSGGGRQIVKGGKIFKCQINTKDVLAYLTGRGESELIIDLKHTKNWHVSHVVE